MNSFEIDESKLQLNKEFVYMTQEQLPQKVTAICHSVINMYNSGIPFYKMTISEIAKKANIGKGTIYEYFTSKEEIIITAMLLELKSELLQICDAIISKQTFNEKYNVTLYWIVERIQSNLLLRQMILARYSDNPEQAMCELIKRMMSFTKVGEVLKSMINQGVEEGLFPKPKSMLQEKAAFMSLVIGVMSFLKPDEFGENTTEKVVDYCRWLFIMILQDAPEGLK